jgi:glycosyltransferase involved in cell wall biosynthesis
MKLVIFMRDIEGGVASYIRCFLRHRTSRKYYIKLVLVGDDEFGPERVSDDFMADEVVHAKYRKFSNMYFTLKRLSQFVDDGDLIWANEELELSMINLFRLPNKVINVLHGDSNYYYQNVRRYHKVIEGFIGASDWIFRKASEMIDEEDGKSLSKKIFAPVEDVLSQDKLPTVVRKIVCVGRVEEAKGMHHVIGICKELDRLNVNYLITIVGSGKLVKIIEAETGSIKGKIHFTGFLSNNKVLEILGEQEVILFPSYSEAVGLVVVEAMKSGVIPVVSDLKSGLPEIVIEGQTGFRIRIGDEVGFAKKIAYLCDNPGTMESFRFAGIKLANSLFNPKHQTEKIEDFMGEVSSVDFKKEFQSVAYGSRLDSRYLPGKFVESTRKILEYFKKVFGSKKELRLGND